MGTFTVNWLIYVSDNYCLDGNWNLDLVWLGFRRRPTYLIITRTYCNEAVLVTGNLELVGGGSVQSIKKFNQAIKKGCITAEVQLEYNFCLYESLQEIATKSCKIRGEISFTNHEEFLSKNSDLHVDVMAKTEEKINYFDRKTTYTLHINSLQELSMDFERLLRLNDSFLSDVELVCGSVSIQAHKIIPSARSSFFANMFLKQTAVDTEHKVHITDVNVHTFKTIITYIYSGKNR